MRTGASLVLVAAAVVAAPARAEVAAEDRARPWLGIGFEGQGGSALVTEVHPGTAASTAGLQAGDEIVAIGGEFLSMEHELPELVKGRNIGERLTIAFIRDGRLIRVTPRLTAKPTTDEIVYRRFIDHVVPAPTPFDRHGVEVPAAEWLRQPQVWMVFDVRCDRCAAEASALGARLAEDADGATPPVPLRVVLVGQAPETAAFLARVPVVGTVWRVDRDQRSDVSVGLGGMGGMGAMGMRPAPLGRRLLSGLPDPTVDAVTLVIDAQGVVRFATAISAGESAHDGACAAAARFARWRR